MNYLTIDKENVCNGEGLRVVLWLSGCSHKCKGCQNPQTWYANSGIPFDESAKEELFRELDKDYISGLTLSGGDPLFEGNLGDVLNLVTEVNKRYNVLRDKIYVTDKDNNILMSSPNRIRLSTPEKSIWIYTGYEWDHILDPRWHYHQQTTEKMTIGRWRRQQIISQCDVLIDGKYVDSQKDITLKWRGSGNQRVIDVKKSLRSGEIILWCG